jgi:predicted TPR repeat methyltransferase
VLPYIGDINELFKVLAKHLSKDGSICLSFETTTDQDNQGYRLQQTARYAHTIEYIERTARLNKLTVETVKQATLRQDHRKAINGCIAILSHPEASLTARPL